MFATSFNRALALVCADLAVESMSLHNSSHNRLSGRSLYSYPNGCSHVCAAASMPKRPQVTAKCANIATSGPSARTRTKGNVQSQMKRMVRNCMMNAEGIRVVRSRSQLVIAVTRTLSWSLTRPSSPSEIFPSSTRFRNCTKIRS